ncbi:formylmethanofuran--tetrahydromethanopterin N-formyltransferase [Methanothermobacter tenebrarum]|uniref:Formylmethanofuran--tetrahydromethanopterin formyltransferase n=1 Tax=Methanothermobacter tenebrarum TaxID=680118 RepID=A0A328PGS5_9EURY|nr:formylmethanofuran--tetrahydromethanopterin N-formyltransferase [Methanothermobacter tenebrarum]MBC7100995.1 formylmethanofuran--tetrahydromethanopterin N-formyltransferase [Methanobacteriales archaeon]MBC7117431.1 formylmethanofuran--tetrahydromethanopterin N-formyltransferase [Methanobacteriaceae archaeon]NPV64691.1 formylmethanofuran--tetrahydromethanopterin N-formyltransferase [Methanobacteriaceae archaeon]RAO79025.1 formylmethanofuran--tetrahydromethanopterin formyltransferase [Methanot
MKINGTIIEDTFCETFKGKCVRAIVTAHDKRTVKRAAYDATSTPAAVIGRLESGVESFLDPDMTPDSRHGAILQFYFALDNMEKFEVELSYRIRQDILVKPFTSLFDASLEAEGYIDMMKHVGHCGDGYEWIETIHGREMIIVPIAVPDFKIEARLGYQTGIMGANFWYMCKDKESVLEAGKSAIEAISRVDKVITPFDICSAPSKPETKYPWIGPTTNHPYCPSLKTRLGKESKVPDGVKYIPEIVINGLSRKKVIEALRVGVNAVSEFDGVIRVSAGNYEGKLGDDKIFLHEIF